MPRAFSHKVREDLRGSCPPGRFANTGRGRRGRNVLAFRWGKIEYRGEWMVTGACSWIDETVIA